MSGCCFSFRGECGATSYTSCPKDCAFFKTQKQYDEDKEWAEELLKAKGLVVVRDKNEKGREIVTVQKIDNVKWVKK